ncbi:MAG: VacJ family lipoprotein [Thermodesulfobacteriota bacterium]
MRATTRFQTSVLRRLAAGCLALSVMACGASKPLTRTDTQPTRTAASVGVPEDFHGRAEVYDPLEGWNRRVYRFNYYFDKYLFLPVVKTYSALMPDLLEKAVTNVFSNLGDIMNFTNAVLQLKGESATLSLGRLFLNTTLGLGGLWDVASTQGIPKRNEDFGQPLGHYGVPAGPYLVLPVLGPSNLRDGLGLAVDYSLYSVYPPLDPLEYWIEDGGARLAITGVKAVDKRKNIAFRYYESGSPFEYFLVRWLYTEHRNIEIQK